MFLCFFIFAVGFGVWEGLQSIEACSEIHLDGFSNQEVAYEPIFQHFPCFCHLFQEVEVVVRHGINRISGKVGPISFESVFRSKKLRAEK